MAKKSGGVSKSGAIRDYYAANPNAKPMEVSSKLAEQGIEVTPAFVSTVRSTDKRKGKPGRKASKKRSVKRSARVASKTAAPPRASKTAATGEVSLDSLLKVKRIVEEMGGVDDAKTALTALEKLMD